MGSENTIKKIGLPKVSLQRLKTLFNIHAILKKIAMLTIQDSKVLTNLPLLFEARIQVNK